ncbi:MAG: vitamin K epoxide reductase family protein [Acidimicrobiales bacterium]|nr:vitamin K epoxide reductase family protein [Acidimicrobiales bacterium]
MLCLAGIGVSTYLTITHFDKQALACVTNGTFNCEKVTTSPQSEIFGHIPVAFLGLFYFVPMLVLCLPRAWASPHRSVHLARLVGAVAGIGMVVYLITAELFVIKAICLWCSSVHIITFLLFVVIATSSPAVLAATRPDGDDGGWWDEEAVLDVPDGSYGEV